MSPKACKYSSAVGVQAPRLCFCLSSSNRQLARCFFHPSPWSPACFHAPWFASKSSPGAWSSINNYNEQGWRSQREESSGTRSWCSGGCSASPFLVPQAAPGAPAVCTAALLQFFCLFLFYFIWLQIHLLVQVENTVFLESIPSPITFDRSPAEFFYS